MMNNFPALDGQPVTEAHTRACQERGHATHIQDGQDTGVCPRCGEVTCKVSPMTNTCSHISARDLDADGQPLTCTRTAGHDLASGHWTTDDQGLPVVWHVSTERVQAFSRVVSATSLREALDLLTLTGVHPDIIRDLVDLH